MVVIHTPAIWGMKGGEPKNTEEKEGRESGYDGVLGRLADHRSNVRANSSDYPFAFGWEYEPARFSLKNSRSIYILYILVLCTHTQSLHNPVLLAN